MVLIFRDDICDLIGRIASKPADSTNKSEQVKQFEAANPNIPPHILHYIAGQKNSWNLTKLAIYKMYLDGEFLNCESIIIAIEKKMSVFTDQSVVDKLAKEFEDYMRQALHPPTPAAGIGTGEQNPPLPPDVTGGN